MMYDVDSFTVLLLSFHKEHRPDFTLEQLRQKAGPGACVERFCVLLSAQEAATPSGLKWRELDALDDHLGYGPENEITNAKLVEVLSDMDEFERKMRLKFVTADLWDALGVEELSFSSWVRVGDRFFVPARDNVEAAAEEEAAAGGGLFSFPSRCVCLCLVFRSGRRAGEGGEAGRRQ